MQSLQKELTLVLVKLYALVASVGGSPVLKGVRSTIAGVSVATYVDGQLNVGGY